MTWTVCHVYVKLQVISIPILKIQFNAISRNMEKYLNVSFTANFDIKKKCVTIACLTRSLQVFRCARVYAWRVVNMPWHKIVILNLLCDAKHVKRKHVMPEKKDNIKLFQRKNKLLSRGWNKQWNTFAYFFSLRLKNLLNWDAWCTTHLKG